MTERIGYKLNPNKLKGAPQSILPYVCGAFYYTEDYEYFDKIWVDAIYKNLGEDT